MSKNTVTHYEITTFSFSLLNLNPCFLHGIFIGSRIRHPTFRFRGGVKEEDLRLFTGQTFGEQPEVSMV